MREETFKSNTACTPCGHTDIEEFGNMSSDIGLKCSTSTTLKRRSTNPKLSEVDRLNTRTRRCNQSLDSDTTLALCTCQQSRSYPFCDNTHITFNRATNSSLTPILVTIVEPTSTKTLGDNGGTTVKENEVKSNIYDTTYKDSHKSSFLEEPSSIVDNIAQSLYKETPRDEPPIHTPSCTDITSPPAHASPPLPKYVPSSIKDKVNQQNVFTEEEITKHHTRDSLWMIIKGNVYDITTYVCTHPGGERALLKFAGRDGTENVQFHSSKMLEILNSRYFIGKLYEEEQSSRCTIS